jgi:Phage integrase family
MYRCSSAWRCINLPLGCAWKRAGLGGVGFHEARHCCASFWIGAAMTDLKAVSVYMGHSDIGTTLNRYSHLLPRSPREHGEQLDTFLKPPARLPSLKPQNVNPLGAVGTLWDIECPAGSFCDVDWG